MGKKGGDKSTSVPSVRDTKKSKKGSDARKKKLARKRGYVQNLNRDPKDLIHKRSAGSSIDGSKGWEREKRDLNQVGNPRGGAGRTRKL